MEQEAPIYSMSFDEPSEVPPPAEATPDPVDPPPAEPVDTEPEPEGTITIPQGKVVPLGAVQAERGKRKEAEKALAAKEQEIQALAEKAKNWDEAKNYLEQAKPYIEKARADLQKPKETAPAVDPALEQYARDFDLFDTEGKPDVARATRIMRFHDDRAQKTAQQLVAPILQTEASRTAQGLFQQYVSRPEQNGVKVDAKLLAEAFQMVGPELIAANPAVAEVLYMNTIGRQLLSGQKPVSAPPPPLVSESLGPGKTPEVALTDMDTKFMQAAQMKPSDFKETRERYKPGQNNSLE